MDKVIFAIQQIISNAVKQQRTGGVGPLKEIKAVYYGDPVQIPEANLPAIAIQPMESEYILRGSRYDQKECGVEIRLIINKKDFYNDAGSPDNVVFSVQNMIERIETQNELQGVLNSSICGLIQNNICLEYENELGEKKRSASLSRVKNVQYKFATDRGFPTYEGVVAIMATTIGDR